MSSCSGLLTRASAPDWQSARRLATVGDLPHMLYSAKFFHNLAGEGCSGRRCKSATAPQL